MAGMTLSALQVDYSCSERSVDMEAAWTMTVAQEDEVQSYTGRREGSKVLT